MKKKLRCSLAGAAVIGALAAISFGAHAATGEIGINEKNFPDQIFRNYVSETFDKNGDEWLSLEEIEEIDAIDVSFKGISDLTGVEYFTALEILECRDTYLESLDVSSNILLRVLDVSYDPGPVGEVGHLKELYLGEGIALEELNCENNHISKLNLKNCESLK